MTQSATTIEELAAKQRALSLILDRGGRHKDESGGDTTQQEITQLEDEIRSLRLMLEKE